MKKICVVGTGYVGLVTGTCFAELGNRVVGIDNDGEKIERLKQGLMPIYEPGLKELVERNTAAGRLEFTTAYEVGLKEAQFVFICVGTPEGPNGEADLQYVAAAATSIARTMHRPLIIINKSTVPIGTGDLVGDIIKRDQPRPIDFAVVSCPEFLREGSAVQDFMNPDRTVIGSTNRGASGAVADLYETLGSPIIITDLRTAEMIKYASNAFLATRISFINEISQICERLGADVTEVANGMGFDRRIGHHFLQAGVGFGGSCFPKDVKALAHMADSHNVTPRLLNAVMDVNRGQRLHVVEKTRKMLGGLQGKKIGLLGLAFKENTDDMRESPAATVAEMLLEAGAIVRAYDPVAMENAAAMLPDVSMCDNPYEAADGADAIILLTPWNEFKALDMVRIRSSMIRPILIDGRNLYEPADIREYGFEYSGVGRGYDGNGVFIEPSGDIYNIV